MKLSEAIREGSKDTYQTVGTFFSHATRNNLKLGCCALGAAWRVCFPDQTDGEYVVLERLSDCTNTNLWASITDDKAGDNVRLWEAITRRNDLLGDSREEIADWLEAQGL